MKYKLRGQFSTNKQECLNEILRNRGVTDVYRFRHPDKTCEHSPYNLEHIREAADLLIKHLDNNSKICFVVDSDTDGYTSSAILWLYIKNFYPEADLTFTVHEHKQHGLSDKIEWILDENDFNLILCPDSASYDVEYHKMLLERGIDCICLDHHEQLYGEDGEPIVSNFPNTIVVNNQLSPYYENKSLCGAGVVYKFCEVLDDIFSASMSQQYLDLVALGEIADVMNKTSLETNYLITEGLKNIRNKGFEELLKAQSFSLKEKGIPPFTNLNSTDVAFYIGPLINAITRVGTMQEKETMFYCFIEPNRVVQSTKRGAKPGDIETAAGQTARVSGNAKNRQNKIKERAMELIDFKIQKNCLLDNNILVIEIFDEDNIPQEMSGLIAMAVVTKYHKPCMIARRSSDGLLQGSMRSDSNFEGMPNFKKWLEDSSYCEYVAGHDMAAGYGIKEKNLSKFLNYGNSNLSNESFSNCYLVDYVFDADSEDLYDVGYEIASHPEYFGNGMDEVKMIVKNIPIEKFMLMGADKNSTKISFNDIGYVKFKDFDFADEVVANKGGFIDAYVRLNINNYMGTVTLQCFIDDYEIHKVDILDKYSF